MDLSKKYDVIAMRNARDARNASEQNIRQGVVSMYAEHRGDSFQLGLFGGDAYPTVWLDDDRHFGFAMVSDGLGSGNFCHPSLKPNLVALCGSEKDEDLLYAFLTKLYGEAFMDDEEAVAYAVKSFCPLPPNCFFNDNKAEGQCALPFYDRDSQYLASRIVTIGVYYNFRKWFVVNDKAFTPETLSELREALDVYINETLRKPIHELFPLLDAPEGDKRNKYFLPCTLACWFFEDCADADIVKAATFYVGDARAYKLDLVDGVLQISVDDANPETNDMDCIIRYAETRRGKIKPDGSIKVTYTEVPKPCALFCCSDGVYDTCSTVPQEGNTKLGLPAEDYFVYEATQETNDFAFECNFLNAMRQADSLDDVQQLVARHIYCHAAIVNADSTGAAIPRQDGVFATVTHCGKKGTIKRDDSATLAMVFFGFDANGYPAVLKEIKTADTSLDKLVADLENNRDKYCYNTPHCANEASIRQEHMTRQEYKGFMTECLIADADEAFDLYDKVLWGSVPMGYRIGAMQRASFISANYTSIFNLLVRDAKDIYEESKNRVDPTLYNSVKGVLDQIVDCDIEYKGYLSEWERLTMANARANSYKEVYDTLTMRKKDVDEFDIGRIEKKIKAMLEYVNSIYQKMVNLPVSDQLGDAELLSKKNYVVAGFKDAGGVLNYAELAAIVDNRFKESAKDFDELYEYVAKKAAVESLDALKEQMDANREMRKSLHKQLRELITIKLEPGKLLYVSELNVYGQDIVNRIKEVDKKFAKFYDKSIANRNDYLLNEDDRLEAFDAGDGTPAAWAGKKHEHILSTMERYNKINAIVGAVEGPQWGMYNLMDKINEAVEEGKALERKVLAAFDLFGEASTAEREILIEDSECAYKSVGKAGNRSFKG